MLTRRFTGNNGVRNNRTGINWRKSIYSLTMFLFSMGGFLWIAPVSSDEAQNAVLKYTYRADQAEVAILKDMNGNVYLPLMDVAQFYGIQVNFDSQTRRITLGKGKSQIKTVLSQPVFLTGDPISSFPMEPAEVVSGQLGIPPEAAVDVLMAVLNVFARWEPDQQALVVGGIPQNEIREEILAHGREKPGASSISSPVIPSTEAVVNSNPIGGPAPPGNQTNEGNSSTVVPPSPAQENNEVEKPPANQDYRVRRIVIDPGHGGRDIGARGFDRNYCEKQATLDIAKRVADLLKKDEKLQVYMTRSADYYVTLKGRTDFANSHNADLFVSIHCNSNRHSRATGTETYVYGLKPSNNFAAGAARRENGRRGYMDSILTDLHHRKYTRCSFTLADLVEGQIKKRLGQQLRRVQEAPFYVLCRVDMPSILIETAFISNQKEETKLRNSYWKDQIASAIADGILDYRDLVEGKVEVNLENRQARR